MSMKNMQKTLKKLRLLLRIALLHGEFDIFVNLLEN